MCEFQYSTVDRRNVARPRKRWTKSVKSKQVLNGLYLAAADNDTAFSYVTDRSEARTVLPRCYSTSIHTTNTELCSGVNTIWYCSSSQPNMWPITLTGCVPSLQPIGLRQRNCTRTKLAMPRCCEWLVIVFIGSDFKLQHSVTYRIVYFRNLNPCSLANSYQLFRGPSCLHFLSWICWQQDSSTGEKSVQCQFVKHKSDIDCLEIEPGPLCREDRHWPNKNWQFSSKFMVNTLRLH